MPFSLNHDSATFIIKEAIKTGSEQQYEPEPPK